MEQIPGIDLLTGLPHGHTSFVLNTMLPADLLQPPSAEDIDNRKAQWLSKLDPEIAESSNVELLLSGSTYQGLRVPSHIPIATMLGDPKALQLKRSDFDLMAVNSGLLVGHQREVSTANTQSREPIFAVVDDSDTYPGYLRLKVLDESVLHVAGTSLVATCEAGKYLSSFKMLEELLHVPTRGTNEYSITGPSLQMSSLTHNIVTDVDVVVAFKCVSWPQEALDWAERPRVWPPQGIVESLPDQGCYVVGKSHDRSKDSQLEWRYSFSVAENKLASLLNPTQRQCYVLLKILAMELLSPPRILSSYHLKTVLFWMCEDTPTTFWCPTNLSQCFLGLIDRVLHCVIDGNILNYFLPSSNLISHIGPHFLSHLTTKVSAVRKDPFRYLFEFNRKFRFQHTSFLVSWRQIFDPVIRDAKQHAESSSAGSFRAAESQSLLVLITSLLLEGNCESAQRYAELQVKLLQELGQNIPMTPLQYLSYIALKDLPLENTVKVMEYIHEKAPQDYSTLSDLACMYHCRFYEVEDPQEKKNLLEKTEAAFLKVHLNSCSSSTMVDYANFLCDMDRWEDAVPILKKAILEEEALPSCINYYSQKEANIVDKNIRGAIENSKQKGITCFSFSFACYSLIKCYVKLQESEKGLEIAEKLLEHCRANYRGPYNFVSYGCLGYGFTLLGMVERAMTAFTHRIIIPQDPM